MPVSVPYTQAHTRSCPTTTIADMTRQGETCCGTCRAVDPANPRLVCVRWLWHAQWALEPHCVPVANSRPVQGSAVVVGLCGCVCGSCVCVAR